MKPMFGYFAIAALAATAHPALAAAQDSTAAQKRQAAMVLDYTFNAPVNEPVRVFLVTGVKYRAEVQGDGIQLSLKPLMSSVQPPLLVPELGNRVASVSNEAVYTITPRADADYVFNAIGGVPGTSVTLRVYALPPKAKNKP